MSYIYILKSDRNNRYYIGSTNNLERRLLEHNSGKTISLKNLLPVKLVFSKECRSLLEARKLERRLKKFKSRSILEKIIKDRDIKLS